jgi:anti-sigma-K factor RskA
MTELDDIDALAAEYVLGTLGREERLAVSERRAVDPALDAAIGAWEHRLGPLVEVVSPVAPPAGLYNKIRAQISLSSHVISLKSREQALTRRANRWRGMALGMTAIAASLVGVVAWQDYERRQMPTQYVAVLQTGSSRPAFLLTVDTKTNMFVISAIAAPKAPEKSYEVWAVYDPAEKPKSLGVMSEGDMAMHPMMGGEEHDKFMNATFAVSLEPEGGSPTGAPTGPVLFTGKLVKATP